MVKSLVIAAVALAAIGRCRVESRHAVAPVPTIDPQQRHFDHDRHNAEMTKDGHPAPSCSTCHQIDDRSKVDWKIKSGWGSALSATEHTRCFGACHGRTATTTTIPSADRYRRARKIAREDLRGLPSREGALSALGSSAAQSDHASFAAGFTHGKHLTLGPSIESDCGSATARRSRRAHADGRTRCAAAATTRTVRGRRSPSARAATSPAPKASADGRGDAYRLRPGVRSPRSHERVEDDRRLHRLPRQARGGRRIALPRPSMLGCQTRCHDGQKAFSATGTHCTSCHKGTTTAPAMRHEIGLPARRAREAQRQDRRLRRVPRARPDGTLAAPAARKDHLPCANEGCHQNEFVDAHAEDLRRLPRRRGSVGEERVPAGQALAASSGSRR